MIKDYTASYAQNREDILLAAFFDDNEKGFYIDIGGYDPDYDSVTKLFYQRGWHGINIEPQPPRYRQFVNKRTRDINLNVGVSDRNSTMSLRSYDNQGLSTFSKTMKLEYNKKPDSNTEHYHDITVKVVTLSHIFKEQKVSSIQFLKVDVEGLEYEVLNGNNWNKYRPEVICIEANHIQRDWRKLLLTNDYKLVFFDGLNEYYADNNTNRAKKFDYVQSVIFKEPIVNFKLIDDITEYDSQLSKLSKENELLEQHLEAYERRLNEIEHELNSITPLRRHIKRQLKRYARHILRK